MMAMPMAASALDVGVHPAPPNGAAFQRQQKNHSGLHISTAGSFCLRSRPPRVMLQYDSWSTANGCRCGLLWLSLAFALNFVPDCPGLLSMGTVSIASKMVWIFWMTVLMLLRKSALSFRHAKCCEFLFTNKSQIILPRCSCYRAHTALTTAL